MPSSRKTASRTAKVHPAPQEDEIIKIEKDINGNTLVYYKSGMVMKLPVVKPATAWKETEGGKKKKASKPKATKKK